MGWTNGVQLLVHGACREPPPESITADGEIWKSSPKILLDEVSHGGSRLNIGLPPQGVVIVATACEDP